ncbi:MAG: hypothetical protein KKH72_14535 [Alphaproteobacteria bacterium]|nr:hypothetical protein [Alphaproteobacteria bacterium]
MPQRRVARPSQFARVLAALAFGLALLALSANVAGVAAAAPSQAASVIQALDHTHCPKDMGQTAKPCAACCSSACLAFVATDATPLPVDGAPVAGYWRIGMSFTSYLVDPPEEPPKPFA